MNGYTAVWRGQSQNLLEIAQKWTSLIGTHAMKVDAIDNRGNVELYIANEFIDWAHYRETGEHISCWSQTQVAPTRSTYQSRGNLNDELGE